MAALKLLPLLILCPRPMMGGSSDGLPPILRRFSPISQGRVSVLSAVMELNRGAPWYVPSQFIASFHEHYGHDLSSLSTYACHLRLYGVTLNDTFSHENIHDGAAVLRLEYIHPSQSIFKSPPPLYCYYATNFQTGGNFNVLTLYYVHSNDIPLLLRTNRILSLSP